MQYTILIRLALITPAVLPPRKWWQKQALPTPGSQEEFFFSKQINDPTEIEGDGTIRNPGLFSTFEGEECVLLDDKEGTLWNLPIEAKLSIDESNMVIVTNSVGGRAGSASSPHTFDAWRTALLRNGFICGSKPLVPTT